MPSPKLSDCTLYVAGHEVHWVQALASCNRPRRPQEGRITEIAPGLITVRLASRERQYRNHDARRLSRLVRQLGSDVTVDEGWSILRLHGKDGHRCFSIAYASRPLQRCRFDPPRVHDVESLVERVRTHGGATVPASFLLAELEGDA